MASTMAEIVYGTKEEGHVMSEKVSSLATDIYKEFERMIKKYDEDVVKELMPLVVNILENLDQTFTEKQETEVDQELLREDNEQLLTQYEREKQLRKAAEQKYMELEDAVEEEKKELESKVESLDHIVRMLELKGKNSADHLSRMEEKESEMKKEYNKLHERYTELMRTHMDYMERAKILMGTDRIAELGHSPRSRGIFHLPNLKQVNLIPGQGNTPLKSSGSPPGSNAFDMMSPQSGRESNISLRSELSDLDSPDVKEGTRGRPNSRRGRATSDKEQNTDAVDVRESATATKTQDEKSDSAVVPPASVENVSMPEGEAVTSVSMPSGEAVAVSMPVSMPSEEAVESSPLVQDKSKSSTVSSSEQSQTDLSHPESSQSKSESSASQTSSRDISQPPSAVIEKSVEKSERVEKPTDQAKETVSVQEKSSVVEPGVNVRVDVNVHVDRNSSSGGGPRSPQSPGFVGMEDAFEEDNIPGLDRTIAHIVATTPELEEMEESTGSSQSMNTSGRLQSSSRNDASIYDELTVQDADLIGDVDFGADITGRAVNPGDYASSDSDDEQERNSTVSDNFFGMGKELENLILENTELLATKNALNVVKDDLIAKLDELTSEQEILREEINSLQVVKTKLHEKIKDLEIELKKTKEELEKKNQTAKEQEDEDDVPMAQRKRFTRVEMARVLMERNQYKERLMELQEAVRWTEMIRASREHPEITQVKKKSSIWNFFSNLVGPGNPPHPEPPQASRKKRDPTVQEV